MAVTVIPIGKFQPLYRRKTMSWEIYYLLFCFALGWEEFRAQARHFFYQCRCAVSGTAAPLFFGASSSSNSNALLQLSFGFWGKEKDYWHLATGADTRTAARTATPTVVMEVATAVEATAAAMGAAMAVEEVEVLLLVVTGCPTLAPASEDRIGVSCQFCRYCVGYDTNQRF